MQTRKRTPACLMVFVPVLLALQPFTVLRAQGLFEEARETSDTAASAWGISLDGFFRSVLFLHESPDGRSAALQSGSGQVALGLEARATKFAAASAELRFRSGADFGMRINELQIREAYLDLWNGSFNFRMGRFIDPLGKGTFFQPMDKQSPVDPTIRSPDPDDRYLGSWGIRARFTPLPFVRFSASWNPIYEPGRLLIEPVPMPGYVAFGEPDYPGPGLSEGSYGFRVELFTRPMDLTVSGYQGVNPLPGIAFGSFTADRLSLEPIELNLFEKSYRIRSAGAALSVPAGPLLVRAEAAWQQSMENPDSAEYLPLPEVSWTAELEWNPGRLTLVAGSYGKYITEYSTPPADPEIDADIALPGVNPPVADASLPAIAKTMVRERIGSFNRMYNYQLEEIHLAAFLLVRGTFLFDRLEAEIPVIHHLTTGEWIIRPSVTYRPADRLELEAGYEGLFGPDGSLLDLAGPVLNSGFIAFTLNF